MGSTEIDPIQFIKTNKPLGQEQKARNTEAKQRTRAEFALQQTEVEEEAETCKQRSIAEKRTINGNIFAQSLAGKNLLASILDLEALWEQVRENRHFLEPSTLMRTLAVPRQMVYGVRERNRFQTHSSWVLSVNLSPDGQTLASASADQTIKLWSLDGDLIQTLKGHVARVRSVSFSPDGQTLASASDDQTVKLWNLEGDLIQTLEGHSSWVRSVSFSPDGQTLASASDDQTVKLWNLEGDLIQTLEGHHSWVKSVSFSPDGQTLASASNDQTVKLWDRQGNLINTLKGHDDSVRSVSFGPDGQTLVSASNGGDVILWEMGASSGWGRTQ